MSKPESTSFITVAFFSPPFGSIPYGTKRETGRSYLFEAKQDQRKGGRKPDSLLVKCFSIYKPLIYRKYLINPDIYRSISVTTYLYVGVTT